MSSGQPAGVTTKRLKIGRWTAAQADLFEQLIEQFGKNWKKIQTYIKGRTLSQIRSHGQKFFDRIGPLKALEYERKAKILEAIEVLKGEGQIKNKQNDGKVQELPQIAVKTEDNAPSMRKKESQIHKMKNGRSELIDSTIKEQFKEEEIRHSQALIQNSPRMSETGSFPNSENIFAPIFWFPNGFVWSHLGAQQENANQGCNYTMNQ